MRVVEISAREARRIVQGNPHAKKLDVARAIVEMGFEKLGEKLPKELLHPVLGYGPKELYRLHLCDAVAIAVAVA